MNNCKNSVTKWLVCKNLGAEGCAWLDNDNVNNGKFNGELKVAFNSESKDYLEMLAEQRAGSNFPQCVVHEEIARAAREVLSGGGGKER